MRFVARLGFVFHHLDVFFFFSESDCMIDDYYVDSKPKIVPFPLKNIYIGIGI